MANWPHPNDEDHLDTPVKNDENGHVPGEMDERLKQFAGIDFPSLSDKEKFLVRRAYEIGEAAGRNNAMEAAARRFRRLFRDTD